MANPDSGRPGDQPLFEGTRRRHGSRRPSPVVWAVVVLVLAAAGVGGWYWYRSRQAPAPGPVPAATGPADTVSRPAIPAVEPLDLPPLEASDSTVQRLVEGLSSHPRLAAWLATDDLVRRFVTTVANLAAGASPSRVGFLAPDEPFSVRDTAGRLVIDTASYRRYDLLTEAVASLDTEGSARLYRQLHPLFEDAWGELGIPDLTFDDAMARAMGNLLAVEVPDGPVEVEQDEAVYRFVDPEAEALTPAAKHLLRLGPRNARRIQAKLRELADAVGIVPRPVEAAGRG